jgi:acyl-[acyl-carrier-protein]-phospholipid O-acyltransferase/long-chain-fatty-acid--[acyl-carrier-protein] ligase
MVWKPYYDMPALHWLFRLGKAIPAGTGGPREVVASIRAARRELQAGHVVCIFAEGAISRTGSLLPFRRGLEKIVGGLDVPVIPVHLDRLWGSIFSFERGKFLWKWPKHVPYPVTVSFGAPMPSTAGAHAVRQAILELGSEAAAYAKSPRDRLDLQFIRTARSNWSGFAMADSSGRELSYGRTLAASLLLAKWAAKERPGEETIGVLLPPSIGGALANIGLTLAGRVTVNLNFTAGADAMRSAIAQCGIRTVVTSKALLEKTKLEAPEGAVMLEDLVRQAGPFDKLRAATLARCLPARWLAALYGPGDRTPDSLATVVFSSGSTGTPKGVMLSHYNLLANIRAMAQVFWLNKDDRIVGVLPFFHSFGFTVTIWLPLVTGCGALYHASPADANKIGELTARHKGTLLVSTPTFCASYARKCSKEDFATLRFVLVGAEKLRESVARAFHEKFGLELLEGYGCTEMSPVIAVNGPDYRAGGDTQLGSKPSTVGHPLPGVAVEVVHPATMQPLPPNREGLLLVKGPNRMLGYLGQTERTAEVVRGGWYITGDIGALDDEGFLRITDRLSRFSKIAGEMVPHLKVEECIYPLIGDFRCVVAGIPDDQRGERLVVLYTRPDLPPAELWRALSETGLPKLWLPKRENVYQVEALPSLGTGKLDMQAVKAKAQQLADSSAVT